MLLKRIELENFRQFRNKQSIDFSTDSEKNVTIIMAENGVGKTTLAQAFQWVLYSNTDGFRNRSLLNLKEEQKMDVGASKTVRVSLDLIHNNIEYKISRSQLYTKDYTGVTRYNSPELEISYKKDGQIEFITDYPQQLSTIKNILPQELSKYFFFDGERINRMSSEIANGRSKEFADAIESLLGLKALKDAMEHLNPNSKRSVIGKFNEEIDEQCDQKSKIYSQRIEELNEELEKIEIRLDEIETDINKQGHRREKIKSDILNCAETERLQKRYDYLENEIETKTQWKTEKIRTFIDMFNKKTPTFIQTFPIVKALEELSATGKIDKGIPDVKDRTIKFLLERKQCICGADLSDPTCDAVRKLIEELEYVPPKSIGLSIRSFVDRSKEKIDISEDYFDVMENLYKDIRKIENQIEECNNDISQIDTSLLRNNKVADLKQEQNECERTIARLTREKEDLLMKKGADQEELNKTESSREDLIIANDRNIVLQRNRMYAKTIYEQIAKTYKKQEKDTREELQSLINDLFNKIYGSGMYIEIDEKYNIKVFVSELKTSNDSIITYDNIDYSTAQSYSVIFAFIVGIIDMAKKRSSMPNNEHLVETEVYPLVMDAPLSAFDEHRIENICSTIPQIARQVIIIIKDTDGNIAKDNLQHSIGKEYKIKPNDYSEDNNNHSVIESYVEEMEVR